ncbi:hypothetical protein C0991_007794 [Blastosporella zonata]|nr:hypothetical protein C0991_007794 [Blastosporella zonata]
MGGMTTTTPFTFQAGLEGLEVYIKEVQAGTEEYDGQLVVQKLDEFADALVQNELPTIESGKMRAAFTV